MKYFVDEQNVFKKNRACIDHIHSISTIVRARIAENKSTFVCFVDFIKAFDWIQRDLLALKLLKAGVDGRFDKVFKSLYSCSVASLEVNHLQTDCFSTPFGVKHGDVLSPIPCSQFM